MLRKNNNCDNRSQKWKVFGIIWRSHYNKKSCGATGTQGAHNSISHGYEKNLGLCALRRWQDKYLEISENKSHYTLRSNSRTPINNRSEARGTSIYFNATFSRIDLWNCVACYMVSFKNLLLLTKCTGGVPILSRWSPRGTVRSARILRAGKPQHTLIPRKPRGIDISNAVTSTQKNQFANTTT